MSDASVVFLPWVRQGLAARITAPDPLTAPLPAQAPLGVTLAVNDQDLPKVDVRLLGPADIIGLDPRQVVRTEPPAATDNYEANDLVAIEFDNPDLPWLFTPAAADAQGRVRPWLVLVVVQQQPGVRLRPALTEPLAVLEIGAPALPAAELPDLADSWAWAHAQLGTRAGATEADLRTLLGTRPELSVARLMSPRLLTPFTDYIACVVPAFEAGRRAGLGQTAEADGTLTPAWKSGTNAPANITLPVYYQWQFRTGAREDFESIVARLAPRDLSQAVGRRPIDINVPGFSLKKTIPVTLLPSVLLEGALQPVNAPRAVFPDPTASPGADAKPWQDKLRSIVNAGNARAMAPDAEPILGPPLYGASFSSRTEVGGTQPPSWLDELNLDPRERVAAALGTRVIQEQQDALMADAWEQAGEAPKGNQRLRQMQLGLTITTSLFVRHVERLGKTNSEALWRFASPAQSRLVVSLNADQPPVTLRSMLSASSTPDAVISAPMRRLTRPGGAISRRATAAARAAGLTPTSASGLQPASTSGASAIAIANLSPTTGASLAPALASTSATFAAANVTSSSSTASASASVGVQLASAGVAVSSMFRLFLEQPVQMTFSLPKTRGLISFDAVTRRLAASFQSITFARASDLTVAQMAQQPNFTVIGESTPVKPVFDVGVITGGQTAGVLSTNFSTTDLTSAIAGAATTTFTSAPASALRVSMSGEAGPRTPVVQPDPVPPRPVQPPPVQLPQRVDSPDAAAFRAAARRHLGLVNPQTPWFVLAQVQSTVLAVNSVNLRALLDPAPAFIARMQSTILLADGSSPPSIGTVGSTPVFTQPMSEPLAALSQDWLLPGLERVPVDSVALLEPNQRFIEAFMLGLNVEMGRELLWRDFIVDDPRATFFRRFWRQVNQLADGDIAPITEWGARHLGQNGAASNPKQVVLLVRSALFRRYPTAVVYAVPGKKVGNGRQLDPSQAEIHPLFRGSLRPDVTFFGFDLDPALATGDPGCYFVIQQQPTEPRFGFNVEVDFGKATHVPLRSAPAGHALPANTRWAFNSAHMAQITRQLPVRVAIHASELIQAD